VASPAGEGRLRNAGCQWVVRSARIVADCLFLSATQRLRTVPGARLMPIIANTRFLCPALTSVSILYAVDFAALGKFNATHLIRISPCGLLVIAY